MSAQPNSLPDYASSLLGVEETEKKFGMSRNTLWRFRKRHGIRLLTGKKIHVDDMIRGFERERHSPSVNR